uniref:Type 1 phosphatases regulator n=1 Tax=Octactis speculum TaxID=3111310 RepID=A0A7S2C9Q2_9STRA|mmetsp:Transcript_3349/g.3822  ORF Transcript_3349/g.3822 Transcript_3349/m.3822 type:complete len:108 (+) Transcript_3349:3-326(+)
MAQETSVVVVTTAESKTSDHILTLQRKPAAAKPRISWSSDVLDNENMNKKSSKRCCIYHKPREFGQNGSSDSDSDWEGFSDNEPEQGQVDGAAQPKTSETRRSPYHP